MVGFNDTWLDSVCDIDVPMEGADGTATAAACMVYDVSSRVSKVVNVCIPLLTLPLLFFFLASYGHQ